MRSEVESSLKKHIRRVYPVVRGLNQWGSLAEKRDAYFSNEFRLVQEPLIEAIPQYQPGEGSTPDDFTDNAEPGTEETRRLQGLGEILKQSGVDYPLYDHQMKSVMANMRDIDVVVATGTGSGKTESFMFPMMNHLHDEALRCADDGEEKSQRAVKCLMLYPMNALVADQLSRLRELLGNPDISTMLLRKGYGRFPQFGMYTGRTDYHGWFAIDEHADDPDNDEEKWIRNKRTESISSYVNKLGKLQSRKAAWDALVKKYKIPSIGGKVEVLDEGDEATTLAWSELSVRAQKDLLKEADGAAARRALSEKRFRIDPKQGQFDRFNEQDYPALGDDADELLSDTDMVHVGRLGDCLDRELIARYQMHLGGVRQYLAEKYGDEKATHVMDHMGVGVPDVMVTNYSMLEYMLMRPLEHTFWHSTKAWLQGCTRAEDDPMRRKLLLVVDEAHLYKGAMGTEFSLLLNRLLNVLEIDRNRVQFIITSASLGSDDDAKMRYVSGLLSLNGEANEARREAIAQHGMPSSTIMNVPSQDELRLIEEDCERKGIPVDDWHEMTRRKLTQAEVQSLIDVVSDKEEGASQQDTEEAGLMALFGEQASRAREEHTQEGKSMDVVHQQVAYDCVASWPLAYRLKRLLLNPKGDKFPLEEHEVTELRALYEGIRIEGRPDDNFPRRFEFLKSYMFEDPTVEGSNLALDLILDIIASARPFHEKDGTWKGGKSFLPLRMHLLARGDNIPVICPGCGSLFPEGTARCQSEDCAGRGQYRTYTTWIDRNCGGVYLMLWCEANKTETQPGIQLKNDPEMYGRRTFKLHGDLEGFARAHQRVSVEADGHPPWFGMLAHPIEVESIDGLPEHERSDVYRLGLRTGRMVQYIRVGNSNPFADEEYIHVHLPNRWRDHGRGDDEDWREERRNFKEWELRDKYTHHIECRYCSRDFTNQTRTNQYSNLQTRGNEFFLGTISTMNSELDPVPESKDYPHQGRKTLIFTDSRQGAARLATKFKTDSSVDEGRSFFTALHMQPWFAGLPETEKVVGKIYPYLCILAGQKRMNFLNDSEDLGRTTMLIHTASLATYFAIKHQAELDTADLIEQKLGRSPFPARRDNYIRKLILREVKFRRNMVAAEQIRNSPLDLEVRRAREKAYRNKFEEEIVDWIKDGDRFDPVPRLMAMDEMDADKFLFDEDEWNALDIVVTGDENPAYDIREVMMDKWVELKALVENDSLMRACIFSDIVLEDTEDGHIKLSKILHDKLTAAVSSGTLSNDDFVAGVEEWNRSVRSSLGAFNKIPPIIGGLIIRWASNTLFSLPVLGLGTFRSILSPAARDRLLAQEGIEEDHVDMFLRVLPWITSDFSPITSTSTVAGRTRKHSTERSWMSTEQGMFAKTTQRYRSYGGSLTYAAPVLVENYGELFMPTKMGRWLRDLFGEGSESYENLRRISDYISAEDEYPTAKELLRFGPAQGDRYQVFFSADSLLFDPYGDEIEMCSRCLLAKPPSLRDATCFTTGCNETTVVSNNEDQGQIYFNERLAIWREAVGRLINPNQVPRIYRAEEHTAQNSEKLNRDDLFSSTQLYELMFQDIPVTSNKIDGKEGADIEHPPIDILSCSTTMEVGIDIGGLTSVALRNVPPHPANYQQRVGRAGRGSSEVSVALTWVDNTAFATSYFNRPEGLVTSPQRAPSIYVNNNVIRQRHLNAILFQRFFKDEELHPYDATTLRFWDEDDVGGLLESLGTYEQFMSNEIQGFGMEDFESWCDELVESVNQLLAQEIPEDRASDHVSRILQAMNLNITDDEALQYLRDGILDLLTKLGGGEEE